MTQLSALFLWYAGTYFAISGKYTGYDRKTMLSGLYFCKFGTSKLLHWSFYSQR